MTAHAAHAYAPHIALHALLITMMVQYVGLADDLARDVHVAPLACLEELA